MKKAMVMIFAFLLMFTMSACDDPKIDDGNDDNNVVDTVDPVISGAADITITAGDTLDLLDGVTATDDTDGIITSSITVIGTVETNTPGTYTIVYSVYDAAGNYDEVSITVTVLPGEVNEDVPSVAVLSNSDFSPLNTVVDEFVELQATLAVSTTAYDGNASLSMTLDGSNWGGIYVIMDNAVDVSAYDSISIKAQIPSTVDSLSIKFEDGTHNFFVNLLDYATGTEGDWTTFVIPTVAFTDVDFSHLTVIGFWNPRDVNAAYVACVCLFDDLKFINNTVGEDTTAPVISGAVDQTFYVGETVDLSAGVTAIDNKDGNITANISITGTVDNMAVGVYPITYTVSDAAGNESTVTINITIAEAPAAVTVADIVNSDFALLNTVSDELAALQVTVGLSTTAYNGDNSVSIVFPGGNWGGIYVNMLQSVDVSMYNAISLVAQIPDGTTWISFKLEDGTNNFYVNLLDYQTGTDGDWSTFVVPMADFTNLDFQTFKTFGFWNAKDVDSNYIAGTVLVDNMQFVSVAYVSELFNSTDVLFDGIGGKFIGSNSGVVSVTDDAIDGDFAVKMTFDGLSWGGIFATLDTTIDVSSYTNIVFSMKTSVAVDSLVVKLEDGTNNNFVNISSYTPTIDGDWATYTIPLADFTGVDFQTLKLMGFWHPKDDLGNYVACEIIFDNMYFN
ncbi:MAG: immunoglobulin-like domain-containing protein [Acholeplasmataceae bacterium]